MTENTVQHFGSEVEFFQFFANTYALCIVAKAKGAQFIQNALSRVTERGVSQIVTQCDGLGQILIQAQGAGNISGNLTDLQCMDQAVR